MYTVPHLCIGLPKMVVSVHCLGLPRGHLQFRPLKSILENVADVDARNFLGSTALHNACRNGHSVIVKLLSKNGSKISATNDSGNTPLHNAMEYGAIDVVLLLIQVGARVAIDDVPLLIEVGARVDKKN